MNKTERQLISLASKFEESNDPQYHLEKFRHHSQQIAKTGNNNENRRKGDYKTKAKFYKAKLQDHKDRVEYHKANYKRLTGKEPTLRDKA